MKHLLFILLPIAALAQTKDLDDRYLNVGLNVGYHSGVYAGVTQRVMFAKLDFGGLYDLPHEDVMIQLRMGFGYSWMRESVAKHALYGFMPMLNFSTANNGYNTPFGVECVLDESVFLRVDVYKDCICPNIGINALRFFANRNK